MRDMVANISESRVATFFLGILTVVVVGVVLKAAQPVILPLIIAWLLSYILGPPVTILTRHRVPIGLAVSFVLALLLWVCYLGGSFVHARVMVFIEAYPRYEELLAALIETWSHRFKTAAGPLMDMDWGARLGLFLMSVPRSLLTFLSKLTLVIIFLVFMLLGKPFFGYKLRKALSPERASHVSLILASISRDIGGYLAVQLLVSLSTGLCVWLALRLIGVDFAVTWAALAFFLNFIPTVGSIISSIPPVLLSLVQFYPNPWRPLATFIALLAIQMTIGNFIAPKVMGDRLNLSPVVVLISLVFWGWLWGITGALLSVPIASAIKIVCENIEALRPISILMGSGRQYRQEFGA